MRGVKYIESIIKGFEKIGYVTDFELATVIYLLLNLQKALLIEGHPGVGKTEVANMLASFLGAKLIRLQCYEGLDVNSAVYEWNYQKQLLGIKIQEGSNKTEEEKEKHIFGHDFLLERPLLQSITFKDSSPVLLIDEVDRSDEEFEAFLLELLSEFQISIPELGTIKSKHPPWVILTSNRTRELSDALRRRCLYHWIDYPSIDKELKIVLKKLPEIEVQLAEQIVNFIHTLRDLKLSKPPGVAETIDWAMGLLAIGGKSLDVEAVERTAGCILKSNEDIELIRSNDIEEILLKSTGNQ